MYRQITLLFLLLMTVGCSATTNRFQPTLMRSVSFEPPEKYERYYEEVQECSGIKDRPFGYIKWFDTKTWTIKGQDGTVAGGVYLNPNEIYLSTPGTLSEGLVKHEILHYLLKGAPGHPLPFGECAPMGGFTVNIE